MSVKGRSIFYAKALKISSILKLKRVILIIKLSNKDDSELRLFPP